MTHVKICGLTRTEDARVAAEAGARYIGAVLVPDTPRVVTPELARDLSRGLAADLVIVVADGDLATLVDQAQRSGAKVVQLHGTESPELAEALGRQGPWAVWKAVRARTPEQVVEEVRRYAGAVDALLVDGWHPDRIGGSGVEVGWDDLPDLRAALGPATGLVAAGGLTPENVGRVVASVRPDVVDVSSGVERSPGRKDADRVRAFVRAADGADGGR